MSKSEESLYSKMYKNDYGDKFIGERELQGEGRWFIAYRYEDIMGSTYEIWVDRDGDEKLVECDKA